MVSTASTALVSRRRWARQLVMPVQCALGRLPQCCTVHGAERAEMQFVRPQPFGSDIRDTL
jgi:hypothetical protein